MTVNKYDLHIKVLLRQIHTIQAKQYEGDYGAVVILADLNTAIKRAKLTDKQKEVLRLVYIIDLTQGEAGRHLGISQQAIDTAMKAGTRKIAKVYEDWSNRERPAVICQEINV